MPVNEKLRLEAIYFQNLRSMIDTLKGWKASEEPGKIFDILDSCISANSAILLLYKNLGESAADFAAQIKKTGEALDKFKTAVEIYKDELNEKIDDVNNYLNALISDLEQRVQALEGREKTTKLFIYWIEDESTEGGHYEIKDKDGVNVSYTAAKDLFENTMCFLIEPNATYDYCVFTPSDITFRGSEYSASLHWNFFYFDEPPAGDPSDATEDYPYGNNAIGARNVFFNEDGTIDYTFSYMSYSYHIPFIQHYANYATDLITGTGDINSAPFGVVSVGANNPGAPVTNSGMLFTFGTDNDKYQMFFSGAVKNRMYIRYCVTGTWSGWYSALLQGSM